jgi:Protein of unknown function (DUF3048) N-terminal domain/Protein of unknown function (DUF3048) C-terminal domain
LSLSLTMAACSGDESGSDPVGLAQTEGGGSRSEPNFCSLAGAKPQKTENAARPAVAVKVENAEIAYPLSGLEDAEVVFEEVVEGGATRFMALYHCTDSKKVGPVRSARTVDPAIMTPITRILAAAGGNDIVRRKLRKEKIVVIEELTAGKAMRRIAREGLAVEHTLYADTSMLRKLGQKRFDKPPPVSTFAFGDVNPKARSARRVTIVFSPAVTVEYRWKKGKWLRFQDGEPFRDDKNRQIGVDNVVIEEHTVKYARGLVDSAGNRSYAIADVSGKGRAALLRDGKVIVGEWRRKSADDAVAFVDKDGDKMLFARGSTWIHLVPDKKGVVKGSFDIIK